MSPFLGFRTNGELIQNAISTLLDALDAPVIFLIPLDPSSMVREIQQHLFAPPAGTIGHHARRMTIKELGVDFVRYSNSTVSFDSRLFNSAASLRSF